MWKTWGRGVKIRLFSLWPTLCWRDNIGIARKYVVWVTASCFPRNVSFNPCYKRSRQRRKFHPIFHILLLLLKFESFKKRIKYMVYCCSVVGHINTCASGIFIIPLCQYGNIRPMIFLVPSSLHNSPDDLLSTRLFPDAHRCIPSFSSPHHPQSKK